MMSQINGQETRVRARKNQTTVEIHFQTGRQESAYEGCSFTEYRQPEG